MRFVRRTVYKLLNSAFTFLNTPGFVSPMAKMLGDPFKEASRLETEIRSDLLSIGYGI